MCPPSQPRSKNRHVIAFDLYGKGHKTCLKKKEGTYIMDVGKFAKAYVAQKQVDYKLQGNNYGMPDALDYVECTAVEYNDNYVSSFDRRLSIVFSVNVQIPVILTSLFSRLVHNSTTPSLAAPPKAV